MPVGDQVLGSGKVAVVTGAASGIGLGLAQRFAAEAMHVVMADVEEPALEAAAASVEKMAKGGKILPIVTDVSKLADVEALRDRALEAFSAVHVLCNNAGVGGSTEPMWEIPLGEWEWVLGVNLWGVIHGVRVFVPVMIEQGGGHIVNTASIFGVFAGALGPYGVSKHAVVALTEALYFQLGEVKAPIGLSVLCPGAVKTNFGTSARNRPSWAGTPKSLSEAQRHFQAFMNQLTETTGREPIEVAQLVVEAIRTGRFYILTSTNRNEAVRRHAEEILDGRPPAPPIGG
jgi:NAD(P)-dependent dehydrogenase (short-subunit alcohol dehydrogenase family)